MNGKMKEYILSNWDKYNLVDSRKDMIALLNILEAHEENLDSLHDVCINGCDEFCGIFGRFEDDKDIVNTLFEFNVFYNSMEELLVRLKEDFYDCYDDGIYTFEEFIESEDIRRTSDGVVLCIWC